MELFSIVLEIVIALEILGCALFLIRIRKKNSKRNDIEETSKMVKKILLRNRWHNINQMVDYLKENNVNIDYRIR